MEYLIINRWIPKNKTELLEKVWWELEESLDLSSVTLEAHISTIRKKLGKDLIKTIKWVGYVIE
jgi:DNA-binding response OmpR family regulator